MDGTIEARANEKGARDMTTTKPYQMRRCAKCLEYTLPNRMYSEDFAAVFDEECQKCGARARAYIGADDGPATYQRIMGKWPLEGGAS